MDLQREDLTGVIDRLVAELLERGQIHEPPVDVLALAQQALGMTICLDQHETRRSRSRKSAGHRTIYLRPEPTPERHQWTVAQEIGAYFKPEIWRRLGLEEQEGKSMGGESLANLFAQKLLTPEQWFAADVRRLDFDLLELKKKYATASHEVIAWRFLDLPEPSIVTILDNDAIHRRRSNAWPTRRQLEPAELKCQQYVHHHGQPRRVQEESWTVQGWPVHQELWKREILRSVRDE